MSEFACNLAFVQFHVRMVHIFIILCRYFYYIIHLFNLPCADLQINPTGCFLDLRSSVTSIKLLVLKE